MGDLQIGIEQRLPLEIGDDEVFARPAPGLVVTEDTFGGVKAHREHRLLEGAAEPLRIQAEIGGAAPVHELDDVEAAGLALKLFQRAHQQIRAPLRHRDHVAATQTAAVQDLLVRALQRDRVQDDARIDAAEKISVGHGRAAEQHFEIGSAAFVGLQRVGQPRTDAAAGERGELEGDEADAPSCHRAPLRNSP